MTPLRKGWEGSRFGPNVKKPTSWAKSVYVSPGSATANIEVGL